MSSEIEKKKLPKWFWISSLTGFFVPFVLIMLICLAHQFEIRHPDDRFSVDMVLFAAVIGLIFAAISAACTFVGVQIRKRGFWG